ncbi:Transducin beta-like [Chytridiales sp. JEL 0842]|nr:Transducin beta-like [Chytridiales sp. JEL 0842]
MDDDSNEKDDRIGMKRSRKEDGLKRDRKDTRKGSGNDREKRARKESVSLDTGANGRAAEQDQQLLDIFKQPTPQSASNIPTTTFSSNEISNLDGHETDVFACSWNQRHMFLASGSGDGTARIWKLSPDFTENTHDSIILSHMADGSDSKDVTTLDWNPHGNLLATGSYDGSAKIWSKSGELKHTLRKHSGPIFSVKWNKRGDLVLTASMDCTAVIWDGQTGDSRQQFCFHDGPILDVDWKDDVTFASCSTDKSVFVCRLGMLEPVKVYSGHSNEVNSIKWDPSGTYLASGSDDHSVKVWTLESDSALWDFTGHRKEVYTLRWSPSSNSTGASARKLLATASFDNTIRIWDVSSGQCLHVIGKYGSDRECLAHERWGADEIDARGWRGL